MKSMKKVLLPEQSPHLAIEREGDYVIALFNGERIPFLPRDVLTLPIAKRRLRNFRDISRKRSERFPPSKASAFPDSESKSPQVQANGIAEWQSHMKNIVISGASKGIGRATAEKFVARARAFLTCHEARAAYRRYRHRHRSLVGYCLRGVSRNAIPQLEGQVDVLIHNAAKLINDTLQSAESEALADVLNINVIAPQRVNQALIPLMSAGSAILYIGPRSPRKRWRIRLAMSPASTRW